MRVEGDFWGAGYAHVHGLFAPEILKQFLASVRRRFDEDSIPLEQQATNETVLKRPALQLRSVQHRPMETFLWGLTPAVSHMLGRRLLPTYCYFRAYQKGDVCLVHSDKATCEISMSLTLGYSDGEPWLFDIASKPIENIGPIVPTFQNDAYTSVASHPGDGILYQGAIYRHGRVTQNPNRWSAHLFMHWVDSEGPLRDLAFDQKGSLQDSDFTLKDLPAAPPSSFFSGRL